MIIIAYKSNYCIIYYIILLLCILLLYFYYRHYCIRYLIIVLFLVFVFIYYDSLLCHIIYIHQAYYQNHIFHNLYFILYDNNLVDPASSHMLVSKIKPCMSKYKLLYSKTANGSLKQL